MDITAVFLAVASVALVAGYVVYQDRKEKKAVEPARAEPTTTQVYPGRLHGHFVCPDRATAVAARNASLLQHGHTPDYTQDDTDNTSSNNTLLGGGPPYGGIYLSGAFDFTFKADGQVDAEKSWVSVFSGDRHPVQGGMNPDGTIGMSSTVGVNIRGTAKRLVVAEAGREVDTSAAAGVYASMREIDRQNLDGIVDGANVQYAHGVAVGSAVAWESL